MLNEGETDALGLNDSDSDGERLLESEGETLADGDKDSLSEGLRLLLKLDVLIH